MDASYKIQRGIHVHLIQFFMCPEFWVHIIFPPERMRCFFMCKLLPSKPDGFASSLGEGASGVPLGKFLTAEPSPSSLRDASSPEGGRFCAAYRQIVKSSPFRGSWHGVSRD